jgi:iron complex outermembrane receptor protein
MQKFIFLLIFTFILRITFAQSSNEIQGKIIQVDNQEALIGVSILVKGTEIGTTTDGDGKFRLKNITPNSILVISFIGLQTQEVTVTVDKTFYLIALQPDATVLETVTVGFENVNVLSRRRTENVQKIPEAVTAFTSKEIEKSGMKQVGDFLQATPNVNFINSQNQGNVAITLRGVSQVRNGDTPVAFLLDGVTLPSPNSITQELYDIERIEIVKGPQGALYGRNSIGGVINIITRKPTNKPEHHFKIGYGNGNSFFLKGSTSGALWKNKIMYRLAAVHNRRDGLLKDSLFNRTVDFQNNTYLRGQIVANITPKLTLETSFSYGNTEGGAIYWARVYKDFDANNFNSAITSDKLGNNQRKLFDGSFKLRYEFEKTGTLEYIGAYSYADEVFTGDLDFSPLSFLGQRQALLNKAFVHDLRFTSPSYKNLRWIVGLFNTTNNRNLLTTGTADAANPLTETFFGIPKGIGFVPFLQREEENQNTTAAIFGQLNWDITEKIELSAALRYDNDYRSQTNTATKATRTATFDKVQPKLSLAYKATDNLLLYSTYAHGYRSGGFNAPGIVSFPEKYVAETTINYEIGVKSSWLDNRLILNLAAFAINFSNQQLFIVDVATVAQGIINVEETTSRGFEAEIKLRPLKFLDLIGGYGFTDARLTTIADTKQKQYEGAYSPLMPRSTLNLVAQFTLPIKKENNDLIFRIGMQRRGITYWHINNKSFQNPITLFNSRLTWAVKKFTLSAWAENLLDATYNVEYFAKEFSGSASDIRWPAQPRSFGMELGYRIGR